jgi:hypothetical protein
MAKKCPHCGCDNDDASSRCVCGRNLPGAPTGTSPAGPAATSATTAPASVAGAPEPRLVLRKILFVLWVLGFWPLFAALRSHLHLPPIYRTLIGTGALCAPAVASLWFLGREKHPTLRAWRILFLAWAVLLTPVLITIVDGLAEQGWPRGRFNRRIAELLTLVIALAVPALLTALGTLIRTYRITAVLALVTGLDTLVVGVLVIRATARFKDWWRSVTDVLDIIVFGSKLGSYLSIPIGIALILGAIMTWQAARARGAASRAGS